jgi:hypothetical protein
MAQVVEQLPKQAQDPEYKPWYFQKLNKCIKLQGTKAIHKKQLFLLNIYTNYLS